MGKSTVFVNVITEERINQFGRDMEKKDEEKSPIKHKKTHTVGFTLSPGCTRFNDLSFFLRATVSWESDSPISSKIFPVDLHNHDSQTRASESLSVGILL